MPDLFPPPSARFVTPASEKEGLALLERLNRRHAACNPGDSRLESRIVAYELAARMQHSAPEALDWPSESAATRAIYGLDDPVTSDFGRRCLLARRLLERGVRFVQVWSGAGGPKNNWDNHSDIPGELPAIARSVDRPIAALLRDLKARGLLEDTLVVWCTEFGRMPFTQGATGRDHNGGTSVAWLAGAGIKGGSAHGESDPWAWKAADGPDLLLRPARHDPAPHGNRSHQAHVPPQRNRPPADRRARSRRARDPRLRGRGWVVSRDPLRFVECGSGALPAGRRNRVG